MGYFSSFCWCFLYVFFLSKVQAANIYLIEVPNAEDTHSVGNYDDYDVLTDYEDYDNKFNHIHKANELKKDDNLAMCQRLFGSIYGNRNQHMRCLEALKKKDYIYNMPEGNIKVLKTRSEHDGYGRFDDQAEFSQDYLDVRDLSRTEGFASDYVDVTDLKTSRNFARNCNEERDQFGRIINTNCLLDSRKTSRQLAPSNTKFKFKVAAGSESSSDSSDSNEVGQDILRRKPKRYKVVANDKANTGNDGKSGKKSDDDVVSFINNVDSSASIQDSDSIEVTTRKPKQKKSKYKSKKKSLFDDRYMYMQGNNYYDKEDFRRENKNLRRGGYRMSHFLPKRIHWDEDQYHNLGYFWFNGPKGKYKNI